MKQNNGANGVASEGHATELGPDGRCTPSLALIVGAARSGTTLLRLLLDAHPEIGCPAEAGLPSLMAHMASVWMTVDADLSSDGVAENPGAPTPERIGEAARLYGGEAARASTKDEARALPVETAEWIRATLRVPMQRYLERAEKRVYVDKSLDSGHHLALVQQLFPEVRMVLVYRHVMDTVASGIDASPWGFQAYGYTPYVQMSPGNAVAALASYWLDHVDRALAWEKEHPEACHRVTYEELVLQPERAVTAVQRFLGAAEDLTVLSAAFERPARHGPGDYKIEHTSSVHSESIGRGKRVPVAMLPPALLKAINEKLDMLGYETLDRGWNAKERSVDGRGRGLWADRLAELMGAVRVATGTDEIGPFAVVAEDHRPLRWVIDPVAGSVEQGDGEVEGVLTGTAKDLVLMLTGGENLGVLVRTGRVRHVVPHEEATSPRDLLRELRLIVELLRSRPGDRPVRTS